MQSLLDFRTSRLLTLLLMVYGGAAVFACSATDGDASPEAALGSQSEAILNGAAVTSPQGVEKAIVRIGGCTGTMLTPEWVLTAMHCASNPLTDTFHIAHDPTGETRDSADIRLPPDIGIDALLVKVSPPLDVDPADPNPTLIPVFAGDDSDAEGGVSSAYGYGLRDQIPLTGCVSDSDCPGPGGRCDAVTDEGFGQCYKSGNIVSTAACATKRQCPNGSDCDEGRGCYAPVGFVDVSAPPSKKCTSNASCLGNRLCTTATQFCGTPVGCVTKNDCPAGFSCDQRDRRCVKPSVFVTSAQCNMASSCSSNGVCGGDRLCIDRHCCNPLSDLRTAPIPVRPVARNHQGTWGAPAWNGKVISFEHPTAAGQGILSGDSGGPYFFGNAVHGVTSSSGLEVYSGAFRDWVNSTINPQGSLVLDQRGRHGFFGAGSDVMSVGDLNGDGRTDLLWFRPTTFLGLPTTEIIVSLASANGNFSPEIASGVFSSPTNGIGVADVTGDGADDVVLFQQSGLAAFVLRWTGSTFENLGDFSQGRLGIDDHLLGDINGDGYADVVSFGATGDVAVSFGCGSALGPESVPGCANALNRFGSRQPWASGVSGRGYVGDFNGDGYADVMMYGFASGNQVILTEIKSCATEADCVDACHVWAGKCRADLGQPPTAVTSWLGGVFGRPTAVADINGDDSDDLLYVNQASGRVMVAFSNAHGRSGASFNAPVQVSGDFCRGTLCLPGDNNHDGRDDIIKFMLDSVTGQVAHDVIVGLVP